MRKEYDFSEAKRGAIIASPGKTLITIMLDDDVIEFFRTRADAAGTGYQTMLNTALKSVAADEAGKSEEPLLPQGHKP